MFIPMVMVTIHIDRVGIFIVSIVDVILLFRFLTCCDQMTLVLCPWSTINMCKIVTITFMVTIVLFHLFILALAILGDKELGP
jgi:hypothetical protein